MGGCLGCFVVFIIGAFILYVGIAALELFGEFFFGFALPLGGILIGSVIVIFFFFVLLVLAVLIFGRN